VAAVVNDGFDIAAFHGYLVEHIPEYARPLFLRLLNHLEITATFKSQKQELSLQGYDPSATTEPVYFNDPACKAFVRIDSKLYQRILAGQVRI
jgi:fatty-acyl-CoA synthase